MSKGPVSHRVFIERIVIAVLILAVVLLLWNLRHLLILVFGAVLVAVVFSVVARPFRERLRLPDSLALLCAVLVVAAILGTAAWLFGAEVGRQARALNAMIPEAWQALEARMDAWGAGDRFRQAAEDIGSGNGFLASLGGFAMSVGTGIANFLLVVVGGIYLASQPELYRSGLIKLVPSEGRALAAETLDDVRRALKLWLGGQLVSMVLVGLLTGFGLWLIGVPSALTLGIVAGILEFVPYVGPILAAVPAVLLALAHSPEMALWTLGLYVVVQQIEGNLIQPLVQQRAVEIPPALLLFALVAGGLVFGIVGILFAAPLTVVLYVLVKRLYVQEALHTRTSIPGEDDED